MSSKKKHVCKCEYTWAQYAMVTYLTFVGAFLSTLEIIHVLEHLGLTKLYSILF